MDIFTTDRALLNAKFEGYKLQLVSQEDAVFRYHLPSPLSQVAKTNSDLPLSFHEVRSRITHNHLGILPGANLAAYIDSEFKVISVTLEDSRPPTFQILCELPRPLSTQASSSKRHAEYPCVRFVSESIIFVSDGHGILYVLERDISTRKYNIVATHQLTSDSLPFLLVEAKQTSETAIHVVLSVRSYEPKKDKKSNVEFNVYGIRFPLPLTPHSDVSILTEQWQRVGSDVPGSAVWSEVHQSFVLIGESIYRPLKTDAKKPYDPSPDELAPIPRADEVPDSAPAKPPPYSWVQTADSVTVAFALPSSTMKTDVSVKLETKKINLEILSDASDTLLPFPKYAGTELWESISPSSSYWTWDREGERSFGLLTLHLDKQHEGTKWLHLFRASGLPKDDMNSLEEVPETIDPSELYTIRESLEKYTASLRTGQDASGLGLGTGVPSLAQGEMDDDVDADVGRQVCLTWIPVGSSSDGSLPPSRETPFTLLSTTMPGLDEDIPSLVIKEGVDGTFFTLAPESPPKWQHESTFSALAFVMASKQDSRFKYHIPSKAVFVFESGARGRGVNVFIYRSASKTDLWAKQSVLKVGESDSGALIGVAIIRDSIVCLLERTLVEIKNLQW